MFKKFIDYFNYKKFDFKNTYAVYCALFSQFLFEKCLNFNYWYFIFPLWVFAYYGNRFFMIFNTLIYTFLIYLSLQHECISSFNETLKLVTIFCLIIWFYRDMIFQFLYKNRHSEEVKNLYSIEYIIVTFLMVLALCGLLYFTSRYRYQ